MFFDQSNEIRRRVPGQRGFGKVRVHGDEVFRLAMEIREIAASAAGNQDFFASTIGALKNHPAAPAPSTTASNLWTAVWGKGASRSSPVIITSLTGPKPAHIVIKSSPRFPACAAERSNSTKFAMTRIDFVDWTFQQAPATVRMSILLLM